MIVRMLDMNGGGDAAQEHKYCNVASCCMQRIRVGFGHMHSYVQSDMLGKNSHET